MCPCAWNGEIKRDKKETKDSVFWNMKLRTSHTHTADLPMPQRILGPYWDLVFVNLWWSDSFLGTRNAVMRKMKEWMDGMDVAAWPCECCKIVLSAGGHVHGPI